MSEWLAALPLAQRPPWAMVLPHGRQSLGLVVVRQVCIGLASGVAAQVLSAGVQFGGEFMSQPLGLNSAPAAASHNTQQISLVTYFQHVLAILSCLQGSI